MKYTGRYNSVEDPFDIDHKINEVTDLTRKHIVDLKEDVGEEEFKLIAKAIITEYLEAM